MPELAAIALPSLISAGSSFLGSNAQASGQTGAANAAGAAAQQGFNYLTNSPIGTSYLPQGAAANDSIAALLGVPQGVPVGGAAGPTETPGMLAARAATGSRGGGGSAGIQVGGIDPLNLFGGRKNNSPIQDISQAVALGHPITDAQWAQAGYGPGGSAPGGAAAPGATSVGNPTSAKTAFDNYLNSTGYQFRLDQGNRALASSAGAKGLRASGATAKAITDYGQNTASAEFNNYLTQLTGLSQRGLTAGGAIGSAASGAGGASADAIAQGYGAAAKTNGQGIAGLGAGISSGLNYLLNPGQGFPDSVNITPRVT